jgi:hypothetical protein
LGSPPTPIPTYLSDSELDAIYGCTPSSACSLSHGCEHWPVIFTFSADGDGWQFQAIKYNEDGEEVGAFSGGIIYPCESVKIRLKLDGKYGDGEWASFHAESVIVGDPSPCCVENEDSPFYGAAWEYNSETKDGVPGNSDELADYTESMGV